MSASALIVEDHPLYRDALRLLLGEVFDDSSIEAVDSAEEGLRLAAQAPALRLVLVDPGLPGLAGGEAMAAFRKLKPEALVVAISASDDRRDVRAALQAGAVLFVSKAASHPVIVEVLKGALDGSLKVPQWVTRTGVVHLADEAPIELTTRQHEILTLLCQGHSNKEIGLRLGLAEITVKVHVSSILRTLGVANRTQAVLAARKLGLQTPE